MTHHHHHPRRPRMAVISYPAVGQAVLARNYDPAALTGQLLIRYTADNPNVTQAIAHIQSEPGGFMLPGDISGGVPATCLPLPRVGTSAVFEKADSPVDNLPPQPPAGNNKRVFVGAYDAAGLIQDQRSTPFVAMPAVVRYAVSARHCIWLVYADPATTTMLQPFGETITSDYVPTILAFPDGAAQVRVEMSATEPPGRWRHDPADAEASGPEGLAGTDQPLGPNFQTIYQNSTLHSLAIVSGNFRLNRLVGLWVYGDFNVATTELDVVATPQFAPPAGPTPAGFCLGCHDGFQWPNNSGVVPVQVTWLP